MSILILDMDVGLANLAEMDFIEFVRYSKVEFMEDEVHEENSDSMAFPDLGQSVVVVFECSFVDSYPQAS